MTGRKRIHDLSELTQVAVEALASALSDGDEAHAPGTWRDENIPNQLDHIQQHLDKIEDGSVDDDNYTHLLCRAVILYSLHQREISRDL